MHMCYRRLCRRRRACWPKIVANTMAAAPQHDASHRLDLAPTTAAVSIWVWHRQPMHPCLVAAHVRAPAPAATAGAKMAVAAATAVLAAAATRHRLAVVMPALITAIAARVARMVMATSLLVVRLAAATLHRRESHVCRGGQASHHLVWWCGGTTRTRVPVPHVCGGVRYSVCSARPFRAPRTSISTASHDTGCLVSATSCVPCMPPLATLPRCCCPRVLLPRPRQCCITIQ